MYSNIDDGCGSLADMYINVYKEKLLGMVNYLQLFLTTEALQLRLQSGSLRINMSQTSLRVKKQLHSQTCSQISPQALILVILPFIATLATQLPLPPQPHQHSQPSQALQPPQRPQPPRQPKDYSIFSWTSEVPKKFSFQQTNALKMVKRISQEFYAVLWLIQVSLILTEIQ